MSKRFFVVDRWERHHGILGLWVWVRAGKHVAEAKP